MPKVDKELLDIYLDRLEVHGILEGRQIRFTLRCDCCFTGQNINLLLDEDELKKERDN